MMDCSSLLFAFKEQTSASKMESKVEIHFDAVKCILLSFSMFALENGKSAIKHKTKLIYLSINCCKFNFIPVSCSRLQRYKHNIRFVSNLIISRRKKEFKDIKLRS